MAVDEQQCLERANGVSNHYQRAVQSGGGQRTLKIALCMCKVLLIGTAAAEAIAGAIPSANFCGLGDPGLNQTPRCCPTASPRTQNYGGASVSLAHHMNVPVVTDRNTLLRSCVEVKIAGRI